MKISFALKWYDFWIGFYWDKKKQVLYFCPLPCCVLVIAAKLREMAKEMES